MKDYLSIVIPFYNVDTDLFDACIQQVLQEVGNEIIIIDDGSNSDVAAVLDANYGQDERIVIIHQENRGVSNARNIGMKKATKKWITFLDADDLLDISRTTENIQWCKNDFDMVSFQFSIITDILCVPSDNKMLDASDTNFVELEKKENVLDKLYGKKGTHKFDEYAIGSCWGKVFNRNFLLENSLFFDENVKIGEDLLFMSEIYTKTNKIYFCPSKVYYYRKREDSMCNYYNPEIFTYYDQTMSAFEKKSGINNKRNEVLFNNFLLTGLDIYPFNTVSKMRVNECIVIIKKLRINLHYAESLKNIDRHDYSGRVYLILKLIKCRMYYGAYVLLKIKKIIKGKKHDKAKN